MFGHVVGRVGGWQILATLCGPPETPAKKKLNGPVAVRWRTGLKVNELIFSLACFVCIALWVCVLCDDWCKRPAWLAMHRVPPHFDAGGNLRLCFLCLPCGVWHFFVRAPVVSRCLPISPWHPCLGGSGWSSSHRTHFRPALRAHRAWSGCTTQAPLTACEEAGWSAYRALFVLFCVCVFVWWFTLGTPHRRTTSNTARLAHFFRASRLTPPNLSDLVLCRFLIGPVALLRAEFINASVGRFGRHCGTKGCVCVCVMLSINAKIITILCA